MDFFEYAASLPNPPKKVAFDGATYDAEQDHARLRGQLGRVKLLMRDSKWRTLSEIAQETGGSEASVSARLRDLRKEQYGAHIIERERVEGGLYRYRMKV